MFLTAAPPAAGLKPTAIASRTDFRLRSVRAAFFEMRMRSVALPLALTLAAPEPSFERFSFAIALALPAAPVST